MPAISAACLRRSNSASERRHAISCTEPPQALFGPSQLIVSITIFCATVANVGKDEFAHENGWLAVVQLRDCSQRFVFFGVEARLDRLVANLRSIYVRHSSRSFRRSCGWQW